MFPAFDKNADYDKFINATCIASDNQVASSSSALMISTGSGILDSIALRPKDALRFRCVACTGDENLASKSRDGDRRILVRATGVEPFTGFRRVIVLCVQ